MAQGLRFSFRGRAHGTVIVRLKADITSVGSPEGGTYVCRIAEA
jgi:hypothetical protein